MLVNCISKHLSTVKLFNFLQVAVCCLKRKSSNIILINRSCLDENVAFLTTADSAIKLLPEATRQITGWKGLEYRAAFPVVKPPGANFYPPDMDKMVFVGKFMLCIKEKRKKRKVFYIDNTNMFLFYRNLNYGRAV
jgi:hypothetical protein